MADRVLKLRELKKILRSYGVECDTGRGKGSHVLFYKRFREGFASFPVPRKGDLEASYVKACRRRFRLTPADGVSDDQFYSRK